MTILGIRCTNKDITYAVLDGSRDDPHLIMIETLQIPTGFRPPEVLDWVYKEVQGILARHQVEMIVIKKFEGRRRDQSYADRVSNEAAVTLAAAQNGRLPVFKKVKRTIAKDMGFKGKAKYLRSDLDTGKIADFEDYDNKSKDSILAAWSELK